MTDDKLIEDLEFLAEELNPQVKAIIRRAIDCVRQAAIGDEAIQALAILIEAKDMVTSGPEAAWSARRYAELKTEGWARARTVLAKATGKG